MPKQKEKSSKYQSKFYKVVPTAIFGLAGLFYLAVPYEVIAASGLGFRAMEGDQLIFGIVFLVMAGVFWFVNSRKRK